MTDNWAIQISPRVGDALINLRAQTGDEMLSILSWYEQNATTIASAIQGSQAGAAVAGAFPGSQNVTAPQGQGWENAAPGQQQWGSAPQGPPPAFAQPQAAPQGGGFGGPPTQYDLSGPPSPPPACQHGPMDWRHRNSKAGKEYKGWFCPSKNQQQQCDAQFVR